MAIRATNFLSSGNPSIDYFVSADVMERQDRTAMTEKDESYSEQVRMSSATCAGAVGLCFRHMLTCLWLGPKPLLMHVVLRCACSRNVFAMPRRGTTIRRGR